ncbi:YtoQ family protein [Shouchella shacheensis]|uniref:YtoQ family protein n=1 Tax=Shouchella shacheensis TaxID=1649580 RepID=UPI0007401B06|nr:YtoQ family protein [Shouchella shacheensis]
MELLVYLAGEIHSDWRTTIKNEAHKRDLPVRFQGPMENHERSDNIGEEILGKQQSAVLKDEAASSFNNFRTQIWLKKSDVVIALFGEEYKQWNTATDAANAVTIGKPLILIRPEKLHHALKELSNKAQIVVETPEQAIQALSYIFEED